MNINFEEVGRHAAPLLYREDEWVHRRVESLRIGAPALVRRHVSIDFSIPDDHHAQGGICYFPVTLIRKEPSFIWFDLRDETGRTLPLLTRPENRDADRGIFVELANTVAKNAALKQHISPALMAELRRELDKGHPYLLPRVTELMDTIVNSLSKDTALTALMQLGADGTGRSDDIDFELRNVLFMDARFTELAEQLVENRFLWVPVNQNGRTRRIIKFAYEVPTPNRMKWSQTRRAAFGARQNYWIQGPHMGNRSSYHLTIMTDEDLELVDANLVIGETDHPDGEHPPRIERQVERTIAHLHVTAQGVAVPVLAYGSIRVERQGYLTSATVACLAVALLFAGFAVFARDALTKEHIDGTIAVLLIFPAILAAVLARPAYVLVDHRLLLGLRALISLAGALTVAGAVSVVAMSHEATRGLWMAAAAWAFTTALVHAAARRWPRRNVEASRTV